jgi:hypothetical protein
MWLPLVFVLSPSAQTLNPQPQLARYAFKALIEIRGVAAVGNTWSHSICEVLEP